MFKKLMKQFKHLSQGSSGRRHSSYGKGSSDRRYGYHRGSSSDRRNGYRRGSSSDRRFKQYPMSGSKRYKSRRKYSSS